MPVPLVAAGARAVAGTTGRRAAMDIPRKVPQRAAQTQAATTERKASARLTEERQETSARSMGKSGQEQRIGRATAGAMVACAVVIDGLQALITLVPLIGIIMSAYLGLIAAALFGLWFTLLRVNYFAGKKAGLKILAAFGATVAELVPLMNVLPATTVGVITVILASWAEDKSGDGSVQRAQVLARFARMRYGRISPDARRG